MAVSDPELPKFHDRVGSLVRLSNYNRTAQRNNPAENFNNGVAIGCDPLKEDQLFEVRIDNVTRKKVNNWVGSIEIGVTTCDPNNILNFPTSATGFREGTWVMSGSSLLKDGHTVTQEYGADLDELTEGDRVGVMVNCSKELRFFVNGFDQGVAATKIASKSYAVVNIYGKCSQVSIIKPGSVIRTDSKTTKAQIEEKKEGERIPHPGVVCDGCENQIFGNRFKCMICPYYDLCDSCKKKGLHHEHDMMKITNPVQEPFSDNGPQGFVPPPNVLQWMERIMKCYQKKNQPGSDPNEAPIEEPNQENWEETSEDKYLFTVGESVVAMLDPFGEDEQDRITFHTTCGCLAAVINGQRTAHRLNAMDDFNNGVVLTSRTLKTDELFEVRLDKMIDKWIGSVCIGVTLHSADILDFPSTMTDIRSGTWMMTGNHVMHNGITVVDEYGQNLDSLKEGDRVGVRRSADGMLNFYVNGIDQGHAATNVPKNVYGVVDLYGQAAQATIIDKFAKLEIESQELHSCYKRSFEQPYRFLVSEPDLTNDFQHSADSSLHTAVFHDDMNAFINEVNKVNVNEPNAKGETPLHIAAKTTSRHGANFILKLIENGSDINARNKWGQTPLHYAAIVESIHNIETLIKIANIDVNAKDVNGYNALQSLIGSSSGVDPDDSPFSYDLQKAICILVYNGTDINSQTKYGHSILHLSAMRNDCTPLIQFLISNITRKINMELKDQMGENFLHLYVESEVDEKILETFDLISKKSLITIKSLLSEENVLGRTPWEVLVDASNVLHEGVERILQFGVCVSRCDNLGNTVFHRLAGVSTGLNYLETMETLIKAGADLNARNVYNESAVFVLFMEPVLDIFLKYNINCNVLDRWGRSPLISIMKHRPNPNLLKAVIEKGKVDVNATDIFKSTPLHFAVYSNFPEQVQLLLDYGADINAKDDLGDTPRDTMRRHCSYQCHQILKMGDESVLYTRSEDFQDILLKLPREIKSSTINSPHDVQIVLRLPKEIDNFMDNLIETFISKQPQHSEEVEEVVLEISNLVRSLCIQIAQYDSRFTMSILPTGSAAEGTKVGRPDEFDFVLCLDKLNDITDIVMTKACKSSGFVCLKFKDNPVPEPYLSFSDMEGYFLALPFLQYFLVYLRRALNEPHWWKNGKLYYTFEDKMTVIKGKPVFNFNVYWIGSVYKQLKISVDLVPVVYKKGWWPPNINFNEIPLMNEDIRSAGCFLILQTKTNDFKKNQQFMIDCISQTCNNDRNEQDCIKQRMLRISAAPAEIRLVKSMPTNFRKAYGLAKIIKSKEVCPEILIDKCPYELRNNLAALPVRPCQQIKSYMLKNCTFYLLEEMESSMEEKHSALKLTSKIYERLLYYSDKQYLNPYFLPYSDVFEFEKEEEGLTVNNFILRYKRELSIKLVLGILNRPFPYEYLALA